MLYVSETWALTIEDFMQKHERNGFSMFYWMGNVIVLTQQNVNDLREKP